MVGRRAGRGRPPRRADPVVDRLRRLPLVSCDGARVVRGRRGRGRGERRLRLHQGRPGGAPRPRRGVHERHGGDDRSGRLADDLLPDAGRPPVLLRHLLSEGAVPAVAGRGRRDLAPQRADVEQASDQVAGSCGGWRPACPAAARRSNRVCATGRWRPSWATRTPGAGFGSAPKFPRRRCSRRCCAPTSAPVTGAVGRRRAHRCGDGARRHLRPAGRRVRAVQRGRRLGGAAFREDAVRQRAAATGLRALGAAHRGPAGPPGGGADRGVPDQRPGRRRMFTSSLDADAAGSEGRPTMWTPRAAARGARGRRRRLGGNGFRGHRARHVREHGASVLQLLAEPDDAERFEQVRAALLAARAAGCSRPATTRW